MIIYIGRDYTISSESQKRKIRRDLEKKGHRVALVSSIPSIGKIQVIYY